MQADCELMFSRFVKLFRSLKNAVVSKVTCIIHYSFICIFFTAMFAFIFMYFIQRSFICRAKDLFRRMLGLNPELEFFNNLWGLRTMRLWHCQSGALSTRQDFTHLEYLNL